MLKLFWREVKSTSFSQAPHFFMFFMMPFILKYEFTNIAGYVHIIYYNLIINYTFSCGYIICVLFHDRTFKISVLNIVHKMCQNFNFLILKVSYVVMYHKPAILVNIGLHIQWWSQNTYCLVFCSSGSLTYLRLSTVSLDSIIFLCVWFVHHGPKVHKIS